MKLNLDYSKIQRNHTSLDCDPNIKNGIFNVSWYFNQNLVKNSSKYLFDKNGMELIFKGKNHHYNGYYKCRVFSIFDQKYYDSNSKEIYFARLGNIYFCIRKLNNFSD